MRVHETAVRYAEGGLNVIPLRLDGSKAPRLKEGHHYFKERSTRAEIDNWFVQSDQDSGIGIPAGETSGNLEVLDFENKKGAKCIYDDWYELVEQMGGADLVDRLVLVDTPSGGKHLYFRTETPHPGARQALGKDGELLIETRGHGQYVAAPGSPAEVHKAGAPYSVVHGDIYNVPVITDEERDLLIAAAQSFGEKVLKQPKHETHEGKGRPGDDYNNSPVTWADILEPHGWRLIKTVSNGAERWQRPGKEGRDYSAHANFAGTNLLCVHSSNAYPFAPDTYTKFNAYTLLNHGGDFKEAAKALAAQGHGAPRTYKQKEQFAAGDTDEETGEVIWEAPLLFGSIETPEIQSSLLPSWLGEYADSVAKSTQTPPAMSIMVALATVSTVLQTRFQVQPFSDSDYSEPVNIWTLVAMPPGNRKTAVMNALTFPINAWEDEQQSKLKSEIDKQESKQAILQARIKDLQTKAGKTDDDKTREGYEHDINRLKGEVSEPMRSPRLYTSDVTPERLQNMLCEYGERMAVLSDEGGIFEVMAGLYSDGKSNVDVFLQAHAGSPVRVDRGGRTVMLRRPALTFGVTVQPAIVAELAGGKKKFRGNGTLARFLWCIPRSTVGSRDVSIRHNVPAAVRAEYEFKLGQLLNIQPRTDRNGFQAPHTISLSLQAREMYIAFSQFIESQMGEGCAFEHMQDWMAKLPGASLRVAGLLQVAEYGTSQPFEIDATNMKRSLDLCEKLIEHARAAFDLMSVEPAMQDAKYIVAWLTEHQCESFKQTEIFKLGKFNRSKKERLEKALDVLIERHIISGKLADKSTRKPTIHYRVNPSIYEVSQ